MAIHNDIGKIGEELAVRYLEEQGFRIFDQNYNFEKSEVDIVAYWENPENPGATAELHFIEVKTLSNTTDRNPEDAVNMEKLERMAQVARFYLRERQLISVPTVFDVIAIGLDDIDHPHIEHFEDVYRPETRY